MSKTIRNALAVICVLVIALCAILIVQKVAGGARADLTQQKLYTLSPGTRRILTQLSQPVTLKLYYSRTAAMRAPEGVRYFNAYYLYVRDLLDEYAKLSGGKLTVVTLDPRRYSEEEEDAVELGLKKFPVSEEDNFFFGLAAQTELGKTKAIPFFEPARQEFVEYDISKLISDVVQRDKKKVAVLSSLEVVGPEMTPYMEQMLRMQGREFPKSWTIISHLRETYDVQPVAKDADAIPDGMDFLLVIHPKEFQEKTLFAVDQFVMKGGKLVVFEDPYCLNDQERQQNPYMRMEQRKASDLNALLAKWGVEMEPEGIAVDRALALKAPLMQGQRPQELLPFMQLKEDCLNQKEVITAQLRDIKVAFAGALKPSDLAGVTITPLLSTTATGNVWKPANPFELQMPMAEAIRKTTPDGTKPVLLGCRISGTLKSNFPDGIEVPEAQPEDPAGTEGEKKPDVKMRKLTAIPESKPDATVLVFSDVDMISDMLAYRSSIFGASPQGDNASLLLNALDFLGGSGDLIAIRSRGSFDRPFVVVERIEREAEAATAGQIAELNESIKEYRERLDKLGASATEKNEKIIAGAALAERKKIEADIRATQKKLRQLNAKRRERIEQLGLTLQTHNMLWAPAGVLLIAIVLGIVRSIRRRRYAARRIA